MKPFIFTLIAGVLFPVRVFAVSITQYGWNCDGFLYCNSSSDAVAAITSRIIGTVFNTISIFAVITFMYGGLKMLTSQGEDGKEAGKKAIMYAAIGLALAALTFAGNRIILFVIQTVSSLS